MIKSSISFQYMKTVSLIYMNSVQSCFFTIVSSTFQIKNNVTQCTKCKIRPNFKSKFRKRMNIEQYNCYYMYVLLCIVYRLYTNPRNEVTRMLKWLTWILKSRCGMKLHWRCQGHNSHRDWCLLQYVTLML